MTNWVRLWEDMPNDPKWRVIAKRAGRPVAEVLAVFVHMMTNAGVSTRRGELENWADEDIAAALDMEPEHVEAIREAMQGKTLDGNQLTGWEKRQPKRERDDPNSGDRVKAYRERHKATPENMKRHVTPCNASEDHATPGNAQNRIEENRIEYKLASLRASAREGQADSGAVEIYRACRAASGWPSDSAPPADSIGPIVDLVADGVSLEKRILPVIETKAAELDRFGHDPPDRWSYFVPVIQDQSYRSSKAATPIETVIVREDDEKWQALVASGKKPSFLRTMLKPDPDGKAYLLWPADKLPSVAVA